MEKIIGELFEQENDLSVAVKCQTFCWGSNDIVIHTEPSTLLALPVRPTQTNPDQSHNQRGKSVNAPLMFAIDIFMAEVASRC